MLTVDYEKNVTLFEDAIGYGKSFDILEKRLAVKDLEVAFFYVDGFVKDGELQRVMQFFLSQKELGSA